MLEKTLESPLDYKEIQPVNPKRNESWIFTGRTDAEAEGPILWSPDGKNWLIGKDSDAGKDLRWEEKGMTENEMVGWHHWLNGHESEQTLGVGDGQGSLTCCSPWGCKQSDTMGLSNWTELNWTHFSIPAGAAAKSIQSCPTLCDPIDGSPGVPLPSQYSYLENSMDCIVHGVTKSQTHTERLSLTHCC